MTQRRTTAESGDLDELWGAGTPDGFRRLWAPHRMAYIAGEAGTGEVDRAAARCAGSRPSTTARAWCSHRGDAVYAVLNLHPYNPGHLMVVPYRHVAGLDELDLEESAELVAVTQQAVRALRAVAAPHGYNVGHQPRARRRRVAGRPPAPARRPALGRRRQLHHRRRPDEGDPAAARRDTVRACAARRLARRAVINQWARAAIKGVVEPTAALAGAPRRAPRRGHGDRHRRPRPPRALWLIPTGHLVAGVRRRGRLRAARRPRRRDGPRAGGDESASGACSTRSATGSSTARSSPGSRGGRSTQDRPAARGPRAGLPGHRPADLLHQGPRRGRGPARRRRPGGARRAPDPRAPRRRAHRDSACPTRSTSRCGCSRSAR